MVNRSAASEMIGMPGSAHEIGIILENRKYIDEVLAHTRSVIDGGPHTQAYHWKDAMPELYSLAEIKHKGVVVVVMLLFILVGIGNINTLLMSVMERIREFGVLRAIGVKKSGIRVIVMAETVMLAIVGVLAGTIGGTLLSWYFSIKGIDISGLMKEQGMSGAMLDPVLYPTIDIPGMLVFIIGMFIITLVAGFYPTFQVLKARPSEAMRVY
jgi:ABC-type lipoprotein release transport system permease subunit